MKNNKIVFLGVYVIAVFAIIMGCIHYSQYLPPSSTYEEKLRSRIKAGIYYKVEYHENDETISFITNSRFEPKEMFSEFVMNWHQEPDLLLEGDWVYRITFFCYPEGNTKELVFAIYENGIRFEDKAEDQCYILQGPNYQSLYNQIQLLLDDVIENATRTDYEGPLVA